MLDRDDADEYDFDLIDKLVEKYQAPVGAQPPPVQQPQQPQQKQLQQPPQAAQVHAQPGADSHGHPLQPWNHVHQQWHHQQAAPTPGPTGVPPHGLHQQHQDHDGSRRIQQRDNRRPEQLQQQFMSYVQNCPPTWQRQPQPLQQQQTLLQQQQQQQKLPLQQQQQQNPGQLPVSLCMQPQPAQVPQQYEQQPRQPPMPQQYQQQSPQLVPHVESVVVFPPHQVCQAQQHQQGQEFLWAPRVQQQQPPHPPLQQPPAQQQQPPLPQPRYLQVPLQQQQQRPPPHGASLVALPDQKARHAPAGAQHQIQQPAPQQPQQGLGFLQRPGQQQQHQPQQPWQGQGPGPPQQPPQQQYPQGQQAHQAPMPQQQQQPRSRAPVCDAGPVSSAVPGAATAMAMAQPGAIQSKEVKFTASLSLEDNKKFAVRVGYHDALKAVFGIIRGASGYDHAVKGWTFPLSEYKHVMEAVTGPRLKTRGLQVTLEPTLPDFVRRMLDTAAARTNDERLYERLTRQSHEGEQSLDQKMMPFQREGVRHALRSGGRVLIGDEMGLGKTVQACCLLKCYSDDWPALVVVPKSLMETWADALFMWLKLTDEDVFVANGRKDVDTLVANWSSVQPRVMVISYDTLSRSEGQVEELKPSMVVLDEAHYIKNGKAKRTEAVLPLVKQARRAVLLTGTPALSKPNELVPLLQGLFPTANIKATAFSERYCVPDRRHPGKFVGSRNEPELNRLLRGTVMVRRLKADVLTHLPPKRRQQVFIRLPDKELRELAKKKRELEGIRAVASSMMSVGGGSGLAGVNKEQQLIIMDLWRANAVLKKEAVADYCADLLEAEGSKFLLFAHHKVLLDAVEEKVKSKARYIRIDGETSTKDRNELTKKFQEDADVKVAILSIKAAGVGLTLTASSLVVFAELSWVPGDIQQAEDRCHRIGQHTSVNIHFLLVRNSIDELMWDTLQNKLDDVGKVLDGSGAFIKVDTTREVRNLGASAVITRPPQLCDGTDEHATSPDSKNGDAPELRRSPQSLPLPSGATGGKVEGAARGTGKTAATAAGSRPISDFYAPVGAAGQAGASGSKVEGGGSGTAGFAGQKRSRAAPDDVVQLLSDEDDDQLRDFKRTR